MCCGKRLTLFLKVKAENYLTLFSHSSVRTVVDTTARRHKISSENNIATGLEPRTTYLLNEHSTIWPNWPVSQKKWFNIRQYPHNFRETVHRNCLSYFVWWFYFFNVNFLQSNKIRHRKFFHLLLLLLDITCLLHKLGGHYSRVSRGNVTLSFSPRNSACSENLIIFSLGRSFAIERPSWSVLCNFK